MDREALSLPVSNSQFYTAAVSSLSSMLTPIAQTPVEKDEKDGTLTAQSPNTPVFELTEEVEKKFKNWSFSF